MKYVIVSIYELGCYFSVCDNGEVYEKKDIFHRSSYEYGLYENHPSSFNELLENHYRDYDLIVVCEDGIATVVKDTTKKGKEI